MHNLNDALEMLRCKLPAQLPADAYGIDMAIMDDTLSDFGGSTNSSGKLTKIETLRAAHEYIRALTRLLQDGDEVDEHHSPQQVGVKKTA
jgi:hypothetical protein